MVNLENVKQLNIPQSPGCYLFKDSSGKIIYIGKAANLASRVLSYWQKSAEHTPAKYAMLRQINSIEWIVTDSEIEALLLESNLIKKYQPQFNVLMRDDKRYVYIKVSLADEVPGVFLTRKIDKSGRYFGPFVSTTAVRETLKTIRKIWPYCTNRKIQAKPCFYYQINRCAGVCGGIISRKEYLDKVVKPIILFLEGKRDRIVKNYELRITRLQGKLASGQENYEKLLKKVSPEERAEVENEINIVKYELANMKNVLEHTNIIGLLDKYATDVVEVAKLLNLPKVPERIEGYDISNIFGKEAVGSMVVFSAGEPDKNEYRKFKIRIGSDFASASVKTTAGKKASPDKHGDVQMLKEILERRFGRHVILNEPRNGGGSEESRAKTDIPGILRYAQDDKGKWPLPDLIIIDGGKAQLNTALGILKKTKLDIPVIAVSKGVGLRSALAPDKLFFPGEKKPLELPLASPALHLIKRVRDEAHRFAIGYHKKLRSKELFK